MVAVGADGARDAAAAGAHRSSSSTEAVGAGASSKATAATSADPWIRVLLRVLPSSLHECTGAPLCERSLTWMTGCHISLHFSQQHDPRTRTLA